MNRVIVTRLGWDSLEIPDPLQTSTNMAIPSTSIVGVDKLEKQLFLIHLLNGRAALCTQNISQAAKSVDLREMF